MGNNLTPTEVCERLIGPPHTLGPACGLGEKATYSWRGASAWRDAGDIPSPRLMRALLAFSAARRLGLTADHLIWGAEAAEIDEILATRAAPAPVFAPRRRPRGQMEAAE